MKSEQVIVVRELSKDFVLPQHKHTSLKQAFLNLGRRHNEEKQKALVNINFEINKGEFFGIVGRNGSGKSTLLKILAGVYSPTKGGVDIKGNLTPFIELGVGFNPQLSGRDNVFLNGALLGFSHKEMAVMYDEIVEFAELAPFMDQKLKNYSSGMQVRLAFSIAVKARNDILIFDEVLAVGDEAFQRKCLDMFERYKAEKQTVVLVTHDMETVRKFCNRAMLISEGKMVEIGDPRSVADKYSKLNQDSTDEDVERENKRKKTKGRLRVKICSPDLSPKSGFRFGEKMLVVTSWTDIDPDEIESVGVNIFKLSGEHLTGINSRTGSLEKNWRTQAILGLEFKLDITPGKYYLLVEVFNKDGRVIESTMEGLQFTVAKEKMRWAGLVELQHAWREHIEEQK